MTRTDPRGEPVGPILVTGGAGYIGSLLVRRLLDQGDRVRVVDRMIHGNIGLAGLDREANLEVLPRDLRDPRSHGEALAGVATVIHLAAIDGDEACAVDEELAVQTNWTATIALARSASARGVRRFILASTCEVYGSGLDKMLTEESPACPQSFYAETRRHAEEGLLELSGREGFEPILLRFGAAYGLSPRMRFDNTVNLLTLSAVRTGRVALIDGDEWCPFVHVGDIARALVMAVTEPFPVPEPILNVGDNLENYQLRDFREELEARIPGVRVTLVPSTSSSSRRISFDRIERLWGFRATMRLGDGIEEVARALNSGSLRDPEDGRHLTV